MLHDRMANWGGRLDAAVPVDGGWPTLSNLREGEQETGQERGQLAQRAEGAAWPLRYAARPWAGRRWVESGRGEEGKGALLCLRKVEPPARQRAVYEPRFF